MANAQPKPKEENILYVFAYLLTWLSGIILYVTEGQKNKRLKFHSLQAIFLGIIIFVLVFIPYANIIGWGLWILGIVIGVIAYNGQDISIPVIGPYAKRYSK